MTSTASDAQSNDEALGMLMASGCRAKRRDSSVVVSAAANAPEARANYCSSLACAEKITKKYGDLNGKVSIVELSKGNTGLGLSLAGNKDRTKMSVFVCGKCLNRYLCAALLLIHANCLLSGMHPNGSAAKDGRVKVADEILEVTLYDWQCTL